MPRSPSCSDSHTPPRRNNALSPNRSPRRSPSPPQASYEPPQQEPEQQPKLHITNVPDDITEEDLRGIFEPHGNIIDVFIKGNDRGKFCFVKFDTLDEAQAALDCNGSEIREKNIKVQLARPRKPQTGPRVCFKCQQPGHMAKQCPNGDGNNQERPRRNRGEMVSEESQEPKLNIRNIATSATEDDLRNHFEKYGNITDVRIIDKGAYKFGFVSFDTLEEATKGLEGNGTELCGQSLNVTYARPRKPREGGQGGGKTCYKCQKEGHFARECPGVQDMVNEAEEKPARRSPSRSVSGSPKRSPKRQRSPSCSGSVGKDQDQNEKIVPEVSPDQEPKIHVSNFDSEVTNDDLRTLFESCGNINDIFSKEGQRGKFAFIKFDTIQEAQKGLQLNGSNFRDQTLRVVFAKPKAQGGVSNDRPRKNSIAEQMVPEVDPERLPKIFICGLSTEVTEEDLRAKYEPFGNITDCFLKSSERPIAFITFDTLEEAQKALETNGDEIYDQRIKVSLAKPKAQKGGQGGISKSCHKSQQEGHFTHSGENDERPKRRRDEMDISEEQKPKLHINSLSSETTDYDLRNHFEKFGNITDTVVFENANGKFGFVTFDTIEEAKKGLEANGDEIHNQSIRVSFAKPRKPREGDGQGGRKCFKCEQEGHISRQCPSADASNNRRPPQRYNNHMPRNKKPNGSRLVGNGTVYNPFTGTTDSIFGTENSRGDYVCSEMDLETTEPQNRNGYNRSKFNGRSSYDNNFSRQNQMDVEPQDKPQRKRSVSRSASPQQIARKRNVSRSPSPSARAPEVPKAVQVANEMKKQVKEGFEPSSKIDRSRSRSRSNNKMPPKVKSIPVTVPKKRTPSELSY